MNVNSASDIKIRCKEGESLVWKSLEGNKIYKDQWRVMLPDKFRISCQGSWWKLNRGRTIISPYWSFDGSYVTLGASGSNIKEIVHCYAWLTKTSYDLVPFMTNNSISPAYSDTNTKYNVNSIDYNNYFKAYYEFELDSNLPLSDSAITDYTLITTEFQLPHFSLSLTNMSFGVTEYTFESVILWNAGDTQYANFNAPETLTFRISSAIPDWIKSARIENGILYVTCKEATMTTHNLGELIVQCIEYPYLAQKVTLMQDASVEESSEIINGDYLVLEDLWEGNYDFDITFFIDNYNPSASDTFLSLGYWSYNENNRVNNTIPGIAYWLGDITAAINKNPFTDKRNETIIIDIAKLREISSYLPSVTTFYMYGSWYSGIGATDVSFSWKLLKNTVIDVYDSNTNTIVHTIPPFDISNGEYVKINSASQLNSGTTTISCQSTHDRPENYSYTNELRNSIGVLVGRVNNGPGYVRPLLKCEYFKDEDKFVVTSLKNALNGQ